MSKVLWRSMDLVELHMGIEHDTTVAPTWPLRDQVAWAQRCTTAMSVSAGNRVT